MSGEPPCKEHGERLAAVETEVHGLTDRMTRFEATCIRVQKETKAMIETALGNEYHSLKKDIEDVKRTLAANGITVKKRKLFTWDHVITALIAAGSAIVVALITRGSL